MSIQDERNEMILQERIDSDPDAIESLAELTEAAAVLGAAQDRWNNCNPLSGMLMPTFGSSKADIDAHTLQAKRNHHAVRTANARWAAADFNHRRIVAEVRRRLIMETTSELV